MPKRRVYFIDAIKALAILLMITMHVPEYWHFTQCFWSPIVDIFCMAIFFMLSGFTTNLVRFDITKRLRLFIPLLLIGFLCTIYYSKPIVSLFTTMDMNGYWFLWVMIVFGLCLYGIQKSKLNIHLGFAIVEIFFCAIYLFSSNKLRYILSINLCVMYWPYIYIGQLFRRKIVFDFVINKWWITALVFVCLTILYFCYRPSGGAYLILSRIYAVPIILLLFIIAYKAYGNATAKKGIQRIVSIIGQSTLQIYVLHYFFFKVFDLPAIRAFASSHNSIIDDFFITPPCSLLITISCIVLAKIIYKFRLGWVFGR